MDTAVVAGATTVKGLFRGVVGPERCIVGKAKARLEAEQPLVPREVLESQGPPRDGVDTMVEMGRYEVMGRGFVGGQDSLTVTNDISRSGRACGGGGRLVVKCRSWHICRTLRCVQCPHVLRPARATDVFRGGMHALHLARVPAGQADVRCARRQWLPRNLGVSTPRQGRSVTQGGSRSTRLRMSWGRHPLCRWRCGR